MSSTCPHWTLTILVKYYFTWGGKLNEIALKFPGERPHFNIVGFLACWLMLTRTFLQMIPSPPPPVNTSTLQRKHQFPPPEVNWAQPSLDFQQIFYFNKTRGRHPWQGRQSLILGCHRHGACRESHMDWPEKSLKSLILLAYLGQRSDLIKYFSWEPPGWLLSKPFGCQIEMAHVLLAVLVSSLKIGQL